MRQLVDIMGLRRSQTVRPKVPADIAVFVVGDIHGRVDCLSQIHTAILKRAETLPAGIQKRIIYLGDYIDRGPDSALVMDVFVSCPLPGFSKTFLLGNHELAFISFLKGDDAFALWARERCPETRLMAYHQSDKYLLSWLYENGGIETLKSYGVDVTYEPTQQAVAAMRIQLLRKIPTDHLYFLERLELSTTCGDFFFCHAGIAPDRELSEQKPSDLLTIREPFLSSKKTFDKVIVHGHTPAEKPDIRKNRIGLDTHAYATGVLTAMLLQNDQINIFSNSY